MSHTKTTHNGQRDADRAGGVPCPMCGAILSTDNPAKHTEASCRRRRERRDRRLLRRKQG